MKALIRLGLAAAVAASASLGAVAVWPIGKAEQAIELAGDVNRGAYLARAAGCIACHSDVSNGGAPLAGGVSFETPFGTLYSPNLTTDRTHGMGGWSLTEFAKAVRQGVAPNGSPYYPAFPYAFYASFSDQNIADLWAAFQTVPPVAVASKPEEMSFPFDQRWGLKLWRAAFLVPPKTDRIPQKGEIWNRGRQLVEGAGHCAACHTERNILGGRKTGLNHLAGGSPVKGNRKIPNITPAHLKDRGWTVDTLSYALKTGITPDGDALGGTMGEVVLMGTSFLTQNDREAIATYLLDLGEEPLQQAQDERTQGDY